MNSWEASAAVNNAGSNGRVISVKGGRNTLMSLTGRTL